MSIKKYIIEFRLEELQVINDALMQMPYFKVAPVIDVINRQLSKQTEKPNVDSSKSLSGENHE